MADNSRRRETLWRLVEAIVHAGMMQVAEHIASLSRCSALLCTHCFWPHAKQTAIHINTASVSLLLVLVHEVSSLDFLLFLCVVFSSLSLLFFIFFVSCLFSILYSLLSFRSSFYSFLLLFFSFFYFKVNDQPMYNGLTDQLPVD